MYWMQNSMKNMILPSNIARLDDFTKLWLFKVDEPKRANRQCHTLIRMMMMDLHDLINGVPIVLLHSLLSA